MFRKPIPLLAVFILMMAGCESRSDHIHFVVPDGFRGAIIIYPNQPEGLSLKKKNGRYICVVPDNGMLRISDKGPFFRWNSLSASFVNGDPIVVAQEPERLSKDTVAFWPHGCRQLGDGPLFLYDFVGTKADNDAFCKATETGKVIPGTIKKEAVKKTDKPD